jgi:hypothetical protein
MLKHLMNPTQKQITMNTHLKSNHPLYPFDKQITVDIIFQSNKLLYPPVETH